MDLTIDLNAGKKGTIALEKGDVLLTNQHLPISLKEVAANTPDEEGVLVYVGNMEEAKKLVEQHGEEKIYVVEAVGECYKESKYFDEHVKVLGFVDGELYVKARGKDKVKVA